MKHKNIASYRIELGVGEPEVAVWEAGSFTVKNIAYQIDNLRHWYTPDVAEEEK